MRLAAEPAFVLHARPCRESSLLVEVLTADHGRLAGGPNVGQPGVARLQDQAGGEDGRHHRQQTGGGALHPVEPPLALLGVGRRLEGGGARGGDLGVHAHQSSAGPKRANPPT